MLLLLFLWQMVENLYHHCCGIPVAFDGVFQHWLVSFEFRAMLQMFLVNGGVDICQIVHSLNAYMPIFLKLAARQSCPV
jgi:hypothetical protein